MNKRVKSIIDKIIEQDFVRRVLSGEWVGQSPKYAEFANVSNGIIYYHVYIDMGYQIKTIKIDRDLLNPQSVKEYGIRKLKIDKFGLRHFDPNFGGTKILI